MTVYQNMNDSNSSEHFIDNFESNFFDLSDSDHSELPERQWTDYAEITFLVLMLLIGAPLNLLSLYRSFRTPASTNVKKRKLGSGGQEIGHMRAGSRLKLLSASRRGGSIRGRSSTLSQFKSLQIHLTVANLMIICVYGLSQICWLITIEWHGGDFGCRTVKFLHTFCFYATSNMVAMIAIDRLCVTIYIDRQSSRSNVTRCLRTTTVVAWLLACGSSIPQAFFWRAYAPFPEFPAWHQCVTVWVASRHGVTLEMGRVQPPLEHFDHNDNIANESFIPRQFISDNTFYEDLYGGVHLALVFWFPAVIVLCSYGVIVATFHKKIRQTNRETIRRRQCSRDHEAAQFRQSLTAFHKAGSVSEDLVSTTQETSASNGVSKCENGELTRNRSSLLLLGLPIAIHGSQASTMRRQSRDVAINTLTKAKKTTLRKTMWILLGYIITWSPYNILELWRYFDTTFENSYLEFLSNLIVLNAVLNPLIYSM